jgi:hypothetical protein
LTAGWREGAPVQKPVIGLYFNMNSRLIVGPTSASAVQYVPKFTSSPTKRGKAECLGRSVHKRPHLTVAIGSHQSPPTRPANHPSRTQRTHGSTRTSGPEGCILQESPRNSSAFDCHHAFSFAVYACDFLAQCHNSKSSRDDDLEISLE